MRSRPTALQAVELRHPGQAERSASETHQSEPVAHCSQKLRPVCRRVAVRLEIVGQQSTADELVWS